eukprot:gene2754-3385_t
MSGVVPWPLLLVAAASLRPAVAEWVMCVEAEAGSTMTITCPLQSIPSSPTPPPPPTTAIINPLSLRKSTRQTLRPARLAARCGHSNSVGAWTVAPPSTPFFLLLSRRPHNLVPVVGLGALPQRAPVHVTCASVPASPASCLILWCGPVSLAAVGPAGTACLRRGGPRPAVPA